MPPLPTPHPTLYTVGYESASLDALLATLKAAGVTLLVDTRERAQSRRRGFSKTALGLALAEAGTEYRHLRQLGTPPAVRRPYKLDHDFAALRRGYLLHLGAQSEALETLGGWIREQPTALLCYEADPRECHRSLIAGRLRELGLVGEVVDLRIGA